MEQTHYNYAGFWKRFLAHIIDQLLLGIVQFVFFVPIWVMLGLGAYSFKDFNYDEDFVFSNIALQYNNDELSIAAVTLLITFIIIITMISIVIQWLYHALFESSAKQATLGKMALGIIVTDMEGNRISFGRATGRHFGKILSGLILNIGYIIAGFTEKKQALHDILANCLVLSRF